MLDVDANVDTTIHDALHAKVDAMQTLIDASQAQDALQATADQVEAIDADMTSQTCADDYVDAPQLSPSETAAEALDLLMLTSNVDIAAMSSAHANADITSHDASHANDDADARPAGSYVDASYALQMTNAHVDTIETPDLLMLTSNVDASTQQSHFDVDAIDARSHVDANTTSHADTRPAKRFPALHTRPPDKT